MHIYHTTADGRAMVSLPITWEKFDGQAAVVENDKVSYLIWAEYRFVYGDKVIYACRRRSGYGWCSWDLVTNGVLKMGGDLPTRMDLYVPLDVAKSLA
jgi:hypothetical protein